MNEYQSPLGKIIIMASKTGITRLWFADQGYRTDSYIQQNNPVLETARAWLDIYFSGKEPRFEPILELDGTSFQKETWNILKTIPYGKTMTYGEIAKIIAANRNITKMSAQAVGNAISKNKISIIIPCHRVVGAQNKLVGYTGGLERKNKLLELEKTKSSPNRNPRQLGNFHV